MAFVVFSSRWFGFRFTFAHIPIILIEEQIGYLRSENVNMKMKLKQRL